MAPRATVLALLAMVMAGPAAADQKDPRLEAHFAQLLAAPDAQTAQPAETSIWRICSNTKTRPCASSCARAARP